MPKEIIFENNPNKKIGYLYNALGQKVEKGVIAVGTTVKITTYLGNFHYEMGNHTSFVNELKFFATNKSNKKISEQIDSYHPIG